MSLSVFDPVDSGEIPPPDDIMRLADAVVDTARLETTGNLAPYAAGLRSTLRRPDVTGEIPAYAPPAWTAPAREHPVLAPAAPLEPSRPRRYRGERRREVPLLASLTLRLAANLAGSAFGSAAVLLWAVTR